MNSAQWTDADTVAFIALQTVLGESPDNAKKLAIAWKRLRVQAQQHWLTSANNSVESALDKMASLEVVDLDKLKLYLVKNPCGIVLCTIHMGDFLLAILVIVAGLSTTRVSIVRRKSPSDIESKAFAKLKSVGVEYEVLRTSDRTTPLQILRRLKRGEVVVMFYDLPSLYGSTGSIKLLGRKMFWVNGPLVLAARARACIIPFITYTNTVDQARCELQPVISFSSSASDTQIQLAHQQLANFAEAYIKGHPAQWHHWNLIPEMLTAPE